MRFFCCCLTLAVLLAAGAQVQAQTEKIQADVNKKLDQQRAEQKAGLEKMIAEALKNNPDIRVGESKVRDAEAELQRTRMKVLSDIAVVHAEIQAAQAAVNEAGRRPDRDKALSTKELHEAESVYQASKAKLAVLQAKLPYLLGRASPDDLSRLGFAIQTKYQDELMQYYLSNKAKEAAGDKGKAVTDEEFLRRTMLDLLGRVPTAEEMKEYLKNSSSDRREKWVEMIQRIKPSADLARVQALALIQSQAVNRAARELYVKYLNLAKPADSPMLVKLRKALDMTVKVDFQDISASGLINYVGDMMHGVNVVLRSGQVNEDYRAHVHIREPIPLGAFLQYLEDDLHVIFVLRDYGVVVVSASQPLPPGALRVVDFWKTSQEKTNASGERKR